MAGETPQTIGAGAEALWPVLQPHHVGIAWGNPLKESEAVVVCSGDAFTVLLLPAALAPGMEPVLLPAQGMDGGETDLQIAGVFTTMEEGTFSYGGLTPEATTFHEAGLSPSLEHAMLRVPLALLPEDVREAVTNLPFGEEMEEQEWRAALNAHEQVEAPLPLFPGGLGGMAM